MAWHDQGGTKLGVEVFRAAVPTASRRALPAFDLARAEVLGSVQHDQHPPAQALERCQRPGCLNRLEEQPVECYRGGVVQHQAEIGYRLGSPTCRTAFRSSTGLVPPPVPADAPGTTGYP